MPGESLIAWNSIQIPLGTLRISSGGKFSLDGDLPATEIHDLLRQSREPGHAVVECGCAAGGCPDIREMMLGAFHSCVLLGDRSVTCRGMNTYGENNSSIAPKDNPELLTGMTDIQVYAVGRTHSCFVKSQGLLDDNTVRCWGDNRAGQLGGWHRPVGVFQSWYQTCRT